MTPQPKATAEAKSDCKKFRKKPVVIEAFQWTVDEVPDWWKEVRNASLEISTGDAIIPTLEGDMRACVGDWIIRGVKGEVYPCKPDIFEATYETCNLKAEQKKAVSISQKSKGGERPPLQSLDVEGVMADVRVWEEFCIKTRGTSNTIHLPKDLFIKIAQLLHHLQEENTELKKAKESWERNHEVIEKLLNLTNPATAEEAVRGYAAREIASMHSYVERLDKRRNDDLKMERERWEVLYQRNKKIQEENERMREALEEIRTKDYVDRRSWADQYEDENGFKVSAEDWFAWRAEQALSPSSQ